ncbi:Glycosyl hydrolase family 115 [Terribacillus aidingensis]|uniref:Glycosyl hydrolase family 115 n=1 Tax=Terribacillus aidingensis TaxID=586416 RepID=A0A285P435_9BACI|nr:glycosyl hydrolase 115 family protein [Terribacillus aidingensis]SNZ15923.1 Glycosyl hydrolase family 115 [Terribacillus aidingensis]
MNNFYLNRGTKINSDLASKPILNGINILKRDMAKKFNETEAVENKIDLVCDSDLDQEEYRIVFSAPDTMEIRASDDLGFIYALLFLSNEFLKINSFWFWMDQETESVDYIEIPMRTYTSSKKAVKYRGWFINDEVLIDYMCEKNQSLELWDMAFEALLRCGGNMVIPGTDRNSRKFRQKAADTGLWITHHHAEPLGAEMFTRKYPHLEASYKKHPELFHALWEEGIAEQKNNKTVFNLGFRGQGDYPFWAEDPAYDTPQKRGALISELINIQYNLVGKYVDNPVCCTNLYGEVMELYNEGHIQLNPDIIKIWADNGYGKMVSRRQEVTNLRVPALPKSKGRHGIYYHVSFYDLQAANHITMLPNSIDFVNQELHHAFTKGVGDFLIVNCSNIRPHVFYLDAVKKIWEGKEIESTSHAQAFISEYFGDFGDVAACFSDYATCTVKYGDHEDDHAGEQFYNYGVRVLATQWMKDYNNHAPAFAWATGDVSLGRQVAYLKNTCSKGLKSFSELAGKCKEISNTLPELQKKVFDSTIYMQSKLHLYCIQGVLDFCDAYEDFADGKYMRAFYKAGRASEKFQAANAEMRNSEYGVWNGFYENDCLSNCKFTAYILKNLMNFIRMIGEGPRFFDWQRELMYAEDDRRIMLLTNLRNHMTDDELFYAMKEKISIS